VQVASLKTLDLVAIQILAANLMSYKNKNVLMEIGG
jgi:hypothetical protein